MHRVMVGQRWRDRDGNTWRVTHVENGIVQLRSARQTYGDIITIAKLEMDDWRRVDDDSRREGAT